MIWERKQKECMLGIFKISIIINSMYKKIEMSVVHMEIFHNIIIFYDQNRNHRYLAKFVHTNKECIQKERKK